MNLSRKINEARKTLDAHVWEIVKWHFSPKTGCPFWLEFAESLDFDPRKEIRGYADLKLSRTFPRRMAPRWTRPTLGTQGLR